MPEGRCRETGHGSVPSNAGQLLRLAGGGLSALCCAIVLAACQGPYPLATAPQRTPENPSAEQPEGAPDELAGAPALAVSDARAGEADGTLPFSVTLSAAVAEPVTVSYGSEDGTATAGVDYRAVLGTLTFPAESTAAQRIEVRLIDDLVDEDAETFVLRLSDPVGAELAVATATATILDDDLLPLALSSLQVTGAGSMYPAFAAATHHYALTCTATTTLHVRAQAAHTNARLTLMRADENRRVVATGTLTASITVNQNHDVAIELSDAGDTVTYVVHCLPSTFPEIRIVTRTADVSEGLLFVTPHNRSGASFAAIIDNNGVPRFHRSFAGRRARDFRRHANAPTIGGRRARYSVHDPVTGRELLDESFETIRTVRPAGGLRLDHHEFLFTADGNYLFGSLHPKRRDIRPFLDEPGDTPVVATVKDSVIQEVTPEGTVRFQWNSWDHMKINPDCMDFFPGDYSHLNSYQIVDGDIVISFRHCSQVLRIDRSSGTGRIEWKLGGTSPPRHSDTEYLEITGDSAGEICGQHQATVTASGRIVLFDNGNHCIGPRKNESWYTRVVQYDISSGTQARFEREYRQRNASSTLYEGGVTVLEGSGHWLITWGRNDTGEAAQSGVIAISEVDTSGTAVLEIHMSRSGKLFDTYRVYREREADVSIPLNLP